MRKLVVLDVDNCLIYANTSNEDYDFKIRYYRVKKRDHLDSFLNHILQKYDVAIWSANFYQYVHDIVEKLNLKQKVKFIHTEDDCLIKHEQGRVKYVKYLSIIEDYGYDMKDIIMVDDNIDGFPKFKDNVIFIPPFKGEKDGDLLRVKDIIDKAATLEDVRGSLNF